jgi:predicted RNase H-related nuclease YkuK (DUF458 family)
MNFYITLTKTRRKFDKYIKINRIRNKVIVDINELMLEYGVDSKKHRDYFNLMLYTKINHALKKGKDIYYIPDYKTKDIKLTQLFKLKETIDFEIDFNVLLFYDEFIDDDETLSEIINNLDEFTSSQIIKDY